MASSTDLSFAQLLVLDLQCDNPRKRLEAGGLQSRVQNVVIIFLKLKIFLLVRVRVILVIIVIRLQAGWAMS